MVALLFFLLRLLVSPFRPISRLEAENAPLRRQLIVLQRKVRGRVQFTNSDRLFFLQLYRSSNLAMSRRSISGEKPRASSAASRQLVEANVCPRIGDEDLSFGLVLLHGSIGYHERAEPIRRWTANYNAAYGTYGTFRSAPD